MLRTQYAFYAPSISLGGVSLRKGPIDDLVKAIEQLKKQASN